MTCYLLVKFINNLVFCANLTFRNYTILSNTFSYEVKCSIKCCSMNYKPVTHVIFDLDGTLLDTETVYKNIYIKIAESYGKTFTKELRGKVLGAKEHDACNYFITDLGLEGVLTKEEFMKEFTEKTESSMAGIPLKPGARKLVEHLYENKIPIAIATSSYNELVEIKIAHLQDLFQKFHHIVMASSDPEVKKGKPAPDIYLIAASRFTPPAEPEKCLVFEDAPNGVLGSIRANMQVVALRDPSVPIERYSKETTLILESFEDFNPTDFGLPPYKPSE